MFFGFARGSWASGVWSFGLDCFDHRGLGVGLMFHLVRLWLVRFHVVVDMIGALKEFHGLLRAFHRVPDGCRCRDSWYCCLSQAGAFPRLGDGALKFGAVGLWGWHELSVYRALRRMRRVGLGEHWGFWCSKFSARDATLNPGSELRGCYLSP